MVPELELSRYNIPVFEKKKFSMCIPPVDEVLGSPRNIILCGIEAHVCVLHTTYDLLEKGIGVHVVADAVSSRSQTDRFVLRILSYWEAIWTLNNGILMKLIYTGWIHVKIRIFKALLSVASSSKQISLILRQRRTQIGLCMLASERSFCVSRGITLRFWIWVDASVPNSFRCVCVAGRPSWCGG